MAKKQLTPMQSAYQKQVNRINRIVNKLMKEGFNVENPLAKMTEPKRKTRQAVERLQRIKPATIRKTATKEENGKLVTAQQKYKQKHQEKLEANRQKRKEQREQKKREQREQKQQQPGYEEPQQEQPGYEEPEYEEPEYNEPQQPTPPEPPEQPYYDIDDVYEETPADVISELLSNILSISDDDVKEEHRKMVVDLIYTAVSNLGEHQVAQNILEANEELIEDITIFILYRYREMHSTSYDKIVRVLYSTSQSIAPMLEMKRELDDYDDSDAYDEYY